MLSRITLLAVCLTGALAAQGQYVVRHEFNLSAAAGVWAIQQPASGALRVNSKYITISTSAAMKITFERSCSSVSGTDITPTRKAPEFTVVAAKSKGLHTATASGCTVIWGPIDIPSGVAVTIDSDSLSDYLTGDGATKNLVIRSNAVTATGSINWHYEEAKQ